MVAAKGLRPGDILTAASGEGDANYDDATAAALVANPHCGCFLAARPASGDLALQPRRQTSSPKRRKQHDARWQPTPHRQDRRGQQHRRRGAPDARRRAVVRAGEGRRRGALGAKEAPASFAFCSLLWLAARRRLLTTCFMVACSSCASAPPSRVRHGRKKKKKKKKKKNRNAPKNSSTTIHKHKTHIPPPPFSQTNAAANNTRRLARPSSTSRL